jgi:uncharacterized protein with HEPN domain
VSADIRVLLQNILECAQRIEEYTSALTRDEFLANTRTQDAVIRRLEVIGETVKSLPADWKDSHPEVE